MEIVGWLLTVVAGLAAIVLVGVASFNSSLPPRSAGAVLGATGYVGAELVRLLERHPGVRIVGLAARNRDASLSAAERTMALALGVDVYREYGDDVAKRRLEAVMLRARRNITGSRVGRVGSLIVEISLPEGNIRVPADE